MRDGIALIAFTDRGEVQAERLAAFLGGTACRAGQALTLGQWTEQNFRTRTGLVFVGAVGIAVRAVAPYLQNKTEDPAVVVADELGRFVIPLLSGHLGGANRLAEDIAEFLGGTAVITTATDLNGLFAVDLWAKAQNMLVLQPERIKQVSGKLLRGETVSIGCGWPILGNLPSNVRLGSAEDVLVDYRRHSTEALQLIPRNLTLGVGCRRGCEAETLEEGFARFCEERGVRPEAVSAAASIDRKADEEGLLLFCERHDWKLHFFTAEELKSATGDYSASLFVEAAVGVDHVCERAAVLDSGGALVESKYAGNGVTFALAEQKTSFDWSW